MGHKAAQSICQTGMWGLDGAPLCICTPHAHMHQHAPDEPSAGAPAAAG